MKPRFYLYAMSRNYIFNKYLIFIENLISRLVEPFQACEFF